MSRATANKLASNLGASAKELLRPSPTRPAAPEILRISALQLRRWGETRRAEQELPELVSRLIRSELPALGSIRAPSDEQITEPGPDIAVNSPRDTRHVPGGQSVWEVTTAAKVREKATSDLNRHRVPIGWCCDKTSWVFVTTGAWAGKNEWAFQQRAEHPWRSIKVLDATALKSWIDESLGVQIWLMDRMGLKPTGFQWLREAVEEWCSAADPPLDTSLLESSVEKHFTAWCDWIRSSPAKPLPIIGESSGEALLFLQALIERGGSDPSYPPIEGLCVNTEEGLCQQLGSPTRDIVTVPMNETVRDLAVGHCEGIRVVLPETGQPRVSDPLKVVPMGQTAIREFLVESDIDSAQATQLAHASGGSVTVLRRLAHKAGAQSPGIQLSDRQSRILAAAGLFGVWDAGSQADCRVVLRLTGQQSDEDIDEAWTELLGLPETPVWMDGERRGVNSRLDTWQRFTEIKITS